MKEIFIKEKFHFRIEGNFVEIREIFLKKSFFKFFISIFLFCVKKDSLKSR